MISDLDQLWDFSDPKQSEWHYRSALAFFGRMLEIEDNMSKMAMTTVKYDRLIAKKILRAIGIMCTPLKK